MIEELFNFDNIHNLNFLERQVLVLVLDLTPDKTRAKDVLSNIHRTQGPECQGQRSKVKDTATPLLALCDFDMRRLRKTLTYLLTYLQSRLGRGLPPYKLAS